MLQLNEISCWYYLIAILLSLYYAYRGFIGNKIAFEQKNENIDNTNKKRKYNKWEYISVYCIHDALFHFICSIAGFLSVAIAVHLYLSIDPKNGFDAGNSIILIFLSLFGLIGITGQLPQLILQGKIPWIK